jgi:hypothetical protein
MEYDSIRARLGQPGDHHYGAPADVSLHVEPTMFDDEHRNPASSRKSETIHRAIHDRRAAHRSQSTFAPFEVFTPAGCQWEHLKAQYDDPQWPLDRLLAWIAFRNVERLDYFVDQRAELHWRWYDKRPQGVPIVENHPQKKLHETLISERLVAYDENGDKISGDRWRAGTANRASTVNVLRNDVLKLWPPLESTLQQANACKETGSAPPPPLPPEYPKPDFRGAIEAACVGADPAVAPAVGPNPSATPSIDPDTLGPVEKQIHDAVICLWGGKIPDVMRMTDFVKQVGDAVKAKFNVTSAPSLSTCKRYMAKYRGALGLAAD